MTENNLIRCKWLNNNPLYVKYHDEEWGKPEYNNHNLFEMICLEGQQAGLSWLTVLKKREHYRQCFCNFDPHKICYISENDVKIILGSTEIIKHRGKIMSIINNAKCYIEMEKNGEDFSQFIWNFVNHKPIVNSWKTNKEIPTQTPISIALSQALRRRGFTFVGPTICYAFMQACGLVNDHQVDCVCYDKYVL